MNFFKPERAENSGFLSNQTRLPAEVATANESGQKVASCENRRTRETRKPDGGKTPDRKTQVGNLRIFRKPWGIHPSFRFFFSFFSSSSLQLVVWVLGVCPEAHICNPGWPRTRGTPQASTAGSQPSHHARTKKILPSPMREEGWEEGPSYPRLALGLLSSQGWL